jgi:tetratricopeptide (TPR) repeat protein
MVMLGRLGGTREEKTMGTTMRVITCSAVMLMLCWLACGHNSSEPGVSSRQLTAQGWDKFEGGDYDGALSKFRQVLRRNRTYGEAYNGEGWCRLKLDSLDVGLVSFDSAISNGVESADPCAGKAVIYRDLEPVDFQLAIDWSDSALALDPEYTFSHDESLDWKDLRLILGHSYYCLNEYLEAKAQVDILNPDNTLDPDSDTFVDDLLAELQRLGSEI